MPQLPTQMTAEALRDLVASYERAFAEITATRAAHEVLAVRGGQVLSAGGGAAKVTPNTTLALDYGFVRPVPVVEVVYARPAAGSYTLTTSPSRLVSVDGQPLGSVEEAMARPVARTHRVEVVASVSPLRLAIVPETDPLLVAGLEAPVESRPSEGRSYEVLPSATAICGTGRLVYATGHEVELDGTPVLLGRPDATGALAARPGAVYAKFIGHQPAHVRIGYAWFQTAPSA
jgi:hypothetical protein